MPYNFAADSFYTNFVADFLQAKCDF